MIEHFAENHYQLLAIAAGVLLLIELAILGLSTPLLFVGISCAIVSFLSYIGLVSNWDIEILCIAILSIVLTAVLWKYIRAFKFQEAKPDESSDMNGKVLLANTKITKTTGSIDYSGVAWTVRVDPESELESINPDTSVRISKVEGTLLYVLPE